MPLNYLDGFYPNDAILYIIPFGLRCFEKDVFKMQDLYLMELKYVIIMKKEFTIVIEQDEDGIYVASVPELEGCHTQAKLLMN